MTNKEERGRILLKKLGIRIAELRKKRKLSQTELGHLCDIDRQNMWAIESGRINPTTLTLDKICEALNISFKKLFDF